MYAFALESQVVMTRRSELKNASRCDSSFSGVWICFQLISKLILCILLLREVDAHNQNDEVRALLDFKHQTGEEYVPSGLAYWSAWNESAENPCAWPGVLCSANLTVVSLDFSGWGDGPLDQNLEPFSRLPDLRSLDLSSSFFLEIPPSIENLTGLARLDMSQNSIQSSIPAGLSKLVSLQYLYLEGNLLQGAIPSLSGLNNLEFLNLAGNNLTGSFPEVLPAELSSLVSIDLTGNMLNGSIPSLPHLTNLVELRLGDNNFTQFDDSWLPPPELITLDVSGNLLGGVVPAGITNFSTLEQLNMSRNQFSSVPLGISQLFYQPSADGFSMDLSQNQLTGNVLPFFVPEVQNLTSLISLNLSHNSITESLPSALFQNLNILSLDLSYNQLSGPIPNSLPNGTFPLVLMLQNNHLSGDIVDFLLNAFTSRLQVQNNRFTGDLSRLLTSPNWIHSESIVFDISNNSIQMIPTEANPSPLRTLLEILMQSTPLYEVRLARNNFSGIAAPTYFTNVTSTVQVLDLSNLLLEGEISELAFNGTTFPDLQFLDLSNNDLSGPVPQSIVNLPNLAVLDLANNSLNGPMPSVPPRSLVNNPSFFEGNAGLCGDPLPPCKQDSGYSGIKWWLLLIIVGGSLTIAMGSILVATWRWRVYHKRHQQDADLIKALMDKESATLMSFRELKKATNNFNDASQIGEGGFGIVYKGELTDGTIVAIKRRKRDGSEKDKKEFLNEVRILSQVSHRHLVKLLGCCMENQVALLVFEFISNGTLQEHLQGKIGDECLSWKQRLSIAIETADALNYLHVGATIPIYHRDVKSANILLNDGLHAKVADFGISKLASIEATHMSTIAIQGTRGYIDPEYYASYQLSDKSDVYSFGVVLLELISAKSPFDLRRGGEETSLVFFAQPYIQSGCLEELIDTTLMETYNDPSGHGKESILNIGHLARKCLEMRSKARPSMNEVVKELQNLWHEFDLSSKLNEVKEDSQRCHRVSSWESFSSNSSRPLVLENNGSDIEMSQLDSLRSFSHTQDQA